MFDGLFAKKVLQAYHHLSDGDRVWVRSVMEDQSNYEKVKEFSDALEAALFPPPQPVDWSKPLMRRDRQKRVELICVLKAAQYTHVVKEIDADGDEVVMVVHSHGRHSPCEVSWRDVVNCPPPGAPGCTMADLVYIAKSIRDCSTVERYDSLGCDKSSPGLFGDRVRHLLDLIISQESHA